MQHADEHVDRMIDSVEDRFSESECPCGQLRGHVTLEVCCKYKVVRHQAPADRYPLRGPSVGHVDAFRRATDRAVATDERRRLGDASRALYAHRDLGNRDRANQTIARRSAMSGFSHRRPVG